MVIKDKVEPKIAPKVEKTAPPPVQKSTHSPGKNEPFVYGAQEMKKTYQSNHKVGDTEPFVYSWTDLKDKVLESADTSKKAPAPIDHSFLPDHLKPSQPLNSNE